jgi:type II secretory pathway component PulF
MTQYDPQTPAGAFAYAGTAPDGSPVSGSIDARDADAARQKLEQLGVRITDLAPTARPKPAKPLRGDDFIAFNQELAQLARAGLPVEQGLRLIAADLRSGRLATTVREVADDLEKGVPLPEAFEKHRGRFPHLYGRLVDAGIRANNLPAVLFNLGRHLELVQRLRRTLWRGLSYPLMLLVVLFCIVAFLGLVVLPQFNGIFKDFGIRLPAITQLLLDISRAMPAILLVVLAVAIAVPLLWIFARSRGWDQDVVDAAVLPLPLVGPAVRKNLLARWCDAVRVGVDAGLDLPASIDLADDAIGNPSLRRDGARLNQALAAGRRLRDEPRLSLLPPVVPAAIELAGSHHGLSETLASLSTMYQRQSELRIAAIPAVLTPLLILVLGFIVGFVVLGLFAPLISLIQTVSGSGK